MTHSEESPPTARPRPIALDLNQKQRAVFEFCDAFYEEHARAPSMGELVAAFEVTSHEIVGIKTDIEIARISAAHGIPRERADRILFDRIAKVITSDLPDDE